MGLLMELVEGQTYSRIKAGSSQEPENAVGGVGLGADAGRNGSSPLSTNIIAVDLAGAS